MKILIIGAAKLDAGGCEPEFPDWETIVAHAEAIRDKWIELVQTGVNDENNQQSGCSIQLRLQRTGLVAY